MTGKQMLFDMFRTANQDILDEFDVQFNIGDLEFTIPYPGVYRDGANTKVTATSFHPYVYGENQYYYERVDLTELFKSKGYDEPRLTILGKVDLISVMSALKETYGLWIDLEDIQNFQVNDTSVSFDVDPLNYIWLGGLKLSIDDHPLVLAEEFPANVLEGFESPVY